MQLNVWLHAPPVLGHMLQILQRVDPADPETLVRVVNALSVLVVAVQLAVTAKTEEKCRDEKRGSAPPADPSLAVLGSQWVALRQHMEAVCLVWLCHPDPVRRWQVLSLLEQFCAPSLQGLEALSDRPPSPLLLARLYPQWPHQPLPCGLGSAARSGADSFPAELARVVCSQVGDRGEASFDALTAHAFHRAQARDFSGLFCRAFNVLSPHVTDVLLPPPSPSQKASNPPSADPLPLLVWRNRFHLCCLLLRLPAGATLGASEHAPPLPEEAGRCGVSLLSLTGPHGAFGHFGPTLMRLDSCPLLRERVDAFFPAAHALLHLDPYHSAQLRAATSYAAASLGACHASAVPLLFAALTEPAGVSYRVGAGSGRAKIARAGLPEASSTHSSAHSAESKQLHAAELAQLTGFFFHEPALRVMWGVFARLAPADYAGCEFAPLLDVSVCRWLQETSHPLLRDASPRLHACVAALVERFLVFRDPSLTGLSLSSSRDRCASASTRAHAPRRGGGEDAMGPILPPVGSAQKTRDPAVDKVFATEAGENLQAPAPPGDRSTGVSALLLPAGEVLREAEAFVAFLASPALLLPLSTAEPPVSAGEGGGDGSRQSQAGPPPATSTPPSPWAGWAARMHVLPEGFADLSPASPFAGNHLSAPLVSVAVPLPLGAEGAGDALATQPARVEASLLQSVSALLALGLSSLRSRVLALLHTLLVRGPHLLAPVALALERLLQVAGATARRRHVSRAWAPTSALPLRLALPGAAGAGAQTHGSVPATVYRPIMRVFCDQAARAAAGRTQLAREVAVSGPLFGGRARHAALAHAQGLPPGQRAAVRRPPRPRSPRRAERAQRRRGVSVRGAGAGLRAGTGPVLFARVVRHVRRATAAGRPPHNPNA